LAAWDVGLASWVDWFVLRLLVRMVEGRGQRIPRADGEERALRGGDWRWRLEVGWDEMGWDGASGTWEH
jgi:hypothetical protein